MLLTLPTDYVTLRDEVIIPTLLELPCKMTSDKVTAQMLLTAKQESGLTTRYQVGSGIARGLWQMEKPTVNLIMLNKNSAQYLHMFADQKLKLSMYSSSILYDLLDKNDFAACALARLLYWDDPSPLPEIGDMHGSWDYYIKVWRPGKPDFSRWQTAYPDVMKLFDKGNQSV